MGTVGSGQFVTIISTMVINLIIKGQEKKLALLYFKEMAINERMLLAIRVLWIEVMIHRAQSLTEKSHNLQALRVFLAQGQKISKFKKSSAKLFQF